MKKINRKHCASKRCCGRAVKRRAISEKSFHPDINNTEFQTNTNNSEFITKKKKG